MRRATTQDKEIARLERQTITALDSSQAHAIRNIETLWGTIKTEMKLAISNEYHQDFRGTWNLPMIRVKGTLAKINRNIHSSLHRFKESSIHALKHNLRNIYWESAYRHAYMLDQVTPPSFDVKLPRHPSFKEADFYSGTAAKVAWTDRWVNWVDSYESALHQNLMLGAINESPLRDAIDEVEVTRAGSPSYNLWDALSRIIGVESQDAMTLGALDLSNANKDLGVVEIWKARNWIRVCDDCDANDGLPIDEADGEIPLHPNCNCYYRLVPKSWAELLRSGDAEDQDLAAYMDAMGRVPSSMLIKDDNGDLRGMVMVSFEKWMEDHALVAVGQ
jgi:hypothetical protein